MKKEEVSLLHQYNIWANHLILDAAGQLTQQQFLAPGAASWGSLRGTLAHAYAVEVLYRQRCQLGLSPTALLPEDQFADLASLRAAWQQEEEAMSAYITSLTEAEMQQVISYSGFKGDPRRYLLWQVLFQMINHGTQTRAEAAMLLTLHNASPGNIDFIYFIKQS